MTYFVRNIRTFRHTPSYVGLFNDLLYAFIGDYKFMANKKNTYFIFILFFCIKFSS